VLPSFIPEGPVNIIERAHPDLGHLGVFWHTQGSGKSYSMAFFAEKVRRKVPGNFTFLLMTDRHDLDDQIYKTFAGCGIAGKETPRAASGDDLERVLRENHPYVFSLIHKFNKDVNPKEPYSERDDIIVISDEAHRTQAGRLARNMRLALSASETFVAYGCAPRNKLLRLCPGDRDRLLELHEVTNDLVPVLSSGIALDHHASGRQDFDVLRILQRRHHFVGQPFNDSGRCAGTDCKPHFRIEIEIGLQQLGDRRHVKSFR
jgi:hypothetical protein